MMKKLLTILFIFATVFALAACGNSTDDRAKSALSQIYEIDTGSYSGTDVFNHKNVASREPVITHDFPLGKSSALQTQKRVYTLRYSQTKFYPVGGWRLHEYAIGEDGEGRVSLNEDGSIFSIQGCEIEKLDVSKNESAESVRTKLESAISDLVDFSEYEFVSVECSSPDSSDFGLYSFLYYNMIDGYRSNNASVYVESDGTVGGLVIRNLDAESANISGINKELEEELIEEKLKDMYNTEETTYRSHTLSDMRIVIYENEVCIEYTIGSKVYFSSRDCEYSKACRILIPVRLMATSGS